MSSVLCRAYRDLIRCTMGDENMVLEPGFRKGPRALDK